MPLHYHKYHFSSQNSLSYTVNNTPHTPQIWKAKERTQIWDRKLHRPRILGSSCPVRYVPCWGEGQTSVLSTKNKAATMTNIKRPSFSFKKKKTLQARKAELLSGNLTERQTTSKTLCTSESSVYGM